MYVTSFYLYVLNFSHHQEKEIRKKGEKENRRAKEIIKKSLRNMHPGIFSSLFV